MFRQSGTTEQPVQKSNVSDTNGSKKIGVLHLKVKSELTKNQFFSLLEFLNTPNGFLRNLHKSV